MKILYHHRIASKDGQYVHVEELTKALKRQGHEIIFVGPSMVEKDDFGSEGGFVPLLKRYVPGFLYELLELGYSMVAYWKLRRAVRMHKPDCLYERYNIFMLAGLWIKKRYGLPMLLEINAPLFEERKKYNGLALPKLAKWTENIVWRGADKALPVTRVLAERVAQAGVTREKLEVIPNGVDLSNFSGLSTQSDIKDNLGIGNRLVLGFTGFMREWHRLDRVVDVVASSTNGARHLLIVGDGPARQMVEKRAKELGVADYVTITGVVERDKVAQYIASFDIALQPDVVDYASPLKLFEYMALARAIIAPDTANIKEVLTQEVDALLFDPDNPDTFIASIERLCADDELRNRLSKAAAQTIEDRKFTWDNNATRVASLFRKLNSVR